MMKRFAIVLYLLGVTLTATAADSAADAGLTEVRELGRLNGQALACSHTQAASRIKAIVIQYAPKSRRYGEAFEVTTNAAFLAHIKNAKAVCQDETSLANQAEILALKLQAAAPATTHP